MAYFELFFGLVKQRIAMQDPNSAASELESLNDIDKS